MRKAASLASRREVTNVCQRSSSRCLWRGIFLRSNEAVHAQPGAFRSIVGRAHLGALTILSFPLFRPGLFARDRLPLPSLASDRRYHKIGFPPVTAMVAPETSREKASSKVPSSRHSQVSGTRRDKSEGWAMIGNA